MTDDRTLAYPLSWPAGWPRRKGPRDRATFRKSSAYTEARVVIQELARLGVPDWDVIISTNVELRLDGLPRANQTMLGDPGAAVYFKLDGENHVLACDRWDKVEHNLRAVSKHIEALRGMDRWGVGDTKQAFTGYKALPEHAGGACWWDVLELAGPQASLDDVRAAHRRLSKLYHPDGSAPDRAKFDAVQGAYGIARQVTT